MSNESLNDEMIYRLSTEKNLETAYQLSLLGVIAEYLAILIAYFIFPAPLSQWFIYSALALLVRWFSYFIAVKETLFISLVFANVISMGVWLSYGFIISHFHDSQLLIATIFLIGYVSGAIGFLVYIKKLYIFYALITQIPFIILMTSQDGLPLLIGLTVCMTLVFLCILSINYYDLIQQFNLSAIKNNQLYF